jgi:intracellular septation protein A
MNGIFSSTPAPGPIRLIVGSQGLLLVQSFIAWQLPAVPGLFRLLVVITAIIATAALITAALGEDRKNPQPYWRRRHGR